MNTELRKILNTCERSSVKSSEDCFEVIDGYYPCNVDYKPMKLDPNHKNIAFDHATYHPVLIGEW